MTADPAARFQAAAACHAIRLADYQAATGEAFATAEAAFAHYLGAGSAACPALFPFLDPGFYLAQLDHAPPPDVTVFEHYVTEGAARGLRPIPLFDPHYLRAQEAADAPRDIIGYLADPACAGLDPHPLFSKAYYRAANPDVAAAGIDPFFHFLHHGWQEERGFHPFFQASRYRLAGMPRGCDAATFHRCLGAALEEDALRKAQPLFDAATYAATEAGRAAGDAPLLHFLREGWRSGASCFPLFDPGHYRQQRTGPEPPANPFIAYLSDFAGRDSPHPLFDPAFYADAAQVPAEHAGSLLEHFVREGADRGVAPHPRLLLGRGEPTRRGGMRPVGGLVAASGRRITLLAPDAGETLRALVAEAAAAEPAIAPEHLGSCRLHPYSGPPSGAERQQVTVAVKIARCNCVVLSGTPLEDGAARLLLAPSLALATSARPWLALLAGAAPSLRYWHMLRGPQTLIAGPILAAPQARPLVLGQTIVAAQPRRLVVRTDALGLAVLRAGAPQLLASGVELSLLLGGADATAAEERQWLVEFIAMRYADIAALLCLDEAARGIAAAAGVARRPPVHGP